MDDTHDAPAARTTGRPTTPTGPTATPTGDTVGPAITPTGDTVGTATTSTGDTVGTAATATGDTLGPTTVLLSGTEQLLAALPHVIGYHPRRSVVLVATAPGPAAAPHRRRSVLTARLDLPPAEDAEVVVEAFAGPLSRVAAELGPTAGGLDGLLLHVFVHDAPQPVADAVAVAVWTLAASGGHALHDLLLVEDGRYLPLVADGLAGGRVLRLVLGGLDPDRPGGVMADAWPVAATDRVDRPDEHGSWDWRPAPVPADVPGVADLVLSGRSALAGREDVVAAVRRHDGRAASETRAVLDAPGHAAGVDRLAALACLDRWVVEGVEEPDAGQRAEIVVALADRTLRDAVLARWLPALFSVEEVLDRDRARVLRRRVRPWPAREAAALDRLLAVAAAVPRPVSAPLLTVAGVVAWGQGEGTIANEAIDLALEVDPGYRMALLVQAALERGVPPWRRSAEAA